jgi:hypothetical protein
MQGISSGQNGVKNLSGLQRLAAYLIRISAGMILTREGTVFAQWVAITSPCSARLWRSHTNTLMTGQRPHLRYNERATCSRSFELLDICDLPNSPQVNCK